MRTYTYDETLAMLTDVVNEKGREFVYYGDPENLDDSSCYYVKNGEPDCGVGHVLVKAGVPLGDLENEGEYGSMFAGGVLVALRNDGVVDFDDKAQRLLKVFQTYQDSHISWGESLDYAIHVTNEE